MHLKILRDYQKEAVKRIYDFFNSDDNKAKIYISTGLGKTAIIVSAVKEILSDYNNKDSVSVAILSTRRAICEQIKSVFLEEDSNFSVATCIHELTEEKILITTYQDIIKNRTGLSQVDIIICDEARFVRNEAYFDYVDKNHVKFLGLLQDKGSSEGWFQDSVCLFSYSLKDAVRDGYNVYAREHQFIQDFLIHLLDYQGYRYVREEIIFSDGNNNRIRPDIVCEKDGKMAVIEVKAYRNLYNSEAILNNALKQILKYKYILEKNTVNKELSYIIVLPCEISERLQKEVYSQYDVVVWDINNLIYLCEEKKELINLLMSRISYSSLELEAKKPLNVETEQNEVIVEETGESLVEKFVRRLETCKPGRSDRSDKKYETICTEIIKYLFETEFFIISEQHKTNDDMFRMDLLCSLKGTTEFWKFLITFYHTKFVVFEYKNYSDSVSQNLIYATEKYLFPAALRNVAFIVSRKGFNRNAEKAAIGCLKESGKLIVSLDDNDLIRMLTMKENGEEPSDFLLDKVEHILMLVSK